MRTRRSVRAGRHLLIGLLLLAGCSTAVRSTAPPNTSRADLSTPSTSPRPGRQAILWHDCHENYQCGSITVPHDWFAPGGAPIHLAVIRRRAAGYHPMGSLLVNPGGPGEPGVEFLSNFFSYGELPSEILKNFDIVSWDPRGTGASDGIACLSTADLLEAEPLPYPPTKAERDKVAAKDAAQTEHCLATEGTTMSVVGTRETVHDLDALKTALGDQKLTYLGFSYGTAIGLEYLKEFPTHVRAMVLDGIDLPGTDPTSTAYAQVASFEHNLDAFLADCKADRSCAFGDGDPRGALTAFLDGLATGKRIPASYALQDENGDSHNRIGTLGYSEALEGIIFTLYNQKSWPALRSALVEATAHPADGKQLLSFRDQLAGRQLDGTWNHSQEANISISCADQVARATSEFGDPKLIAEWRAKLPFFGMIGAVGQPGCYQIPAPRYPLKALTKDAMADAPPVLLVNSLHDPATPYQNAKDALALLPDAQLVTWEGEDHTSVGSNHACIDDAIMPYLMTTTMPKPGLSCPVK